MAEPIRGILYVKWGTDHEALLQRSIASVSAVHPELKIHVAQLTGNVTMLDKARMFDLSPFDETLYLDTDTIVLDRLDHAFTKAARFGIACSVCECPWARRFAAIAGDVVEYNTGVIFFTRQMQSLFDRWKYHAGTIDSASRSISNGKVVGVMQYNDQASFAVAIEEAGISPFALPINYNFRPSFHGIFCGPLKVWHDFKPLPPGFLERNRLQTGETKLMEFFRFA